MIVHPGSAFFDEAVANAAALIFELGSRPSICLGRGANWEIVLAPNRIMIIRHAEKPDDASPNRGVMADGTENKDSLTVRGWQRAGALVRFFCPVSGASELLPRTIFAAGTGHGSKSERPLETVTPLIDFLEQNGVKVNQHHLKDDLQGLMDDVLKCTTTVLVAWEHKRIPGLVALLPNAPKVPDKWPDDRFDVVWILDSAGAGWSFSQKPQLLLDGDSERPIK
jgi:hypothetical protein